MTATDDPDCSHAPPAASRSAAAPVHNGPARWISLTGQQDGNFHRDQRAARLQAVQQARGYYNARMPVRMIRQQCPLDSSGERTLEIAVRRMGLSRAGARPHLKVARTIADLDASEAVSAKHVAEAVQYRSLDQNYWS